MSVVYAPPRSSQRLLEACRAQGVSLPWSERLHLLGTPHSIGPRQAPNRFVALPMEGCDGNADGSPSDLTLRRYLRFAAGGSAVIWFEATAVCEDGRSNRKALWITDANVNAYRSLVEKTRSEARQKGCGEALLVLQLTHAGRYSRDGEGKPLHRIVHHAPDLDVAFGVPSDLPLVDDGYLHRLVDAYARAARLAQEAGFDGVDMKCCHGYLVSELLAAHTHPGIFGGSYENRTRFLMSALDAIRAGAPDLFLAVRMNAYDGLPFPWGFGVAAVEGSVDPDLTEPKRLAQELTARGVELLSVTIGYPRFDPHLNRPSARYAPGQDFGEHPLKGIDRMIRTIAQIQSVVPATPVVTAGMAWLGSSLPQVAAGMVERGDAALVGQGRGVFAYPDSVNDILRTGAMRPERCCVACSKCSLLMKKGGPTGCVVRDERFFRALGR